jgi:hypothetical protein
MGLAILVIVGWHPTLPISHELSLCEQAHSHFELCNAASADLQILFLFRVNGAPCTVAAVRTVFYW